MDIDFLGCELNLTLIAGEAEKYLLRFTDETGKKAESLSNVTFSAMLWEPSGGTLELDVHPGSRLHEVELTFPAIAEGIYEYEVWATSDDGSRERVIWGRVGVVSSITDFSWLQEGAQVRTLLVRMPGKGRRRLQMSLLATTYAGLMAKKAEEKADEAEESAKEADESKKEAEKQAQAAEIAKAAAEKVQEKVEEAKEAIDKKEKEIEDFVDEQKDWFETEARARKDEVEDFADKKKQELQNAAQEDIRQVGEAKDRALEELADYKNEKIDELEKRVDDVERDVDVVEGKMAMIKGDIRSAVYPNPETNTWWVGGEDTGYQATGDPGKSPRINKETYNWEVYDPETDRWVDTGQYSRGEDGFSPYVDEEGYICWRDGATGAIKRQQLRATIAAVRHIVDSYADIPQEGETCNGGHYYYVPKQAQGEGDTWRSWYDVYAWMEDRGVYGWKCIGEANDVASKEQMGLVKLGTNDELTRGAPVGFNGSQELTVGSAGVDRLGVGMPSTVAKDDGGLVFVDAQGRYYAAAASGQSLGAVKGSYAVEDIDDGSFYAPVAIAADGTIKVRKVSYGQPGVGIVYAYVSEAGMNANYRGYVAAGTSGVLYWPLLNKGFIRQEVGRELRAKFEGVVDFGNSLDDGMMYGYANTSDQFDQFSEGKLVIKPASTSLLAGVYLASAMSDTRAAAVPTAKTITEYLNEYYLRKADAITATAVRELVQEQLERGAYVSRTEAGTIASDQVQAALKNYYNKTEIADQIKTGASSVFNDSISGALANYYTKTQVDSAITSKMSGYLTTSTGDTRYYTQTALGTHATNNTGPFADYAKKSYVTGLGYMTQTTADGRYVRVGTATVVAYTSRSSMPSLSAQQSGVIYMSP